MMLPLVVQLVLCPLMLCCTRSLSSSDTTHISESVQGSLSEDAIPTVVHVLAVLPIATSGSNDAEVTFQWKKGEEILPGATLALKEISESNYVLNGYKIEIIPIRIPSCNYIKGVVPFVRELTSNQNNVIAIIGYFCHNHQQYFSRLIQHESIGRLQLSAIAAHEQYCRSCPQQHSILPSAVFNVRAVIKLMQILEWSKVAVVSNKDLSFVKQVFHRSAKEEGINVSLELEAPLITFELTTQFLNGLLLSGTKIIVAFVSPFEAIEIMCNAQQHNFKWPDYAWIFMEINTNEIEIAISSKTCSQYTTFTIMENSLFVHAWLKTNRMGLFPSGHNYTAYHNAYLEELEKSTIELNISLQYNPYASALYDSIWAIALALNGSLNMFSERNLSFANNAYHRKSEIRDILEGKLSETSFQGATAFLNFSQGAAVVVTSVELFQYQNNVPELIGVYNVSLDDLDLDKHKLGEIPSSTLARSFVLFPVWLTVILTLMAVISFVLTALSMCIFLCYRNQPAIKATSSTLSICMFVGCYFLLTSSLFHTINSRISKHQSGGALRGFVCSLDVYLFNIGFDIVFATVIAKTLRIYLIFRPFGRIGQICSNQGLFALILTIVGFKLMLLILWNSVDIHHLIDIEQYVTTSVPPYSIVVQQCHSSYMGTWIGVLASYSIILLLIMVILAILTRKIKRDHFNDTKKINTLTAVLLFHVCISLSLWLMLRVIGATILSKVMYTLSTMFTAVFCQAFLIAPKIVPVVYNRIKHGKPVQQC